MADAQAVLIAQASPGGTTVLARAAHLVRKGVFAVTDQALFSGANFVVNVLLARWLAPEGYGAFSLAYSVFLLFAALHSAVLIEPMMVFGAGKYAGTFAGYLRRLLRLHWMLMIPSGVVLLAVAVGLGRVYSRGAGEAFAGLVAGSGFVLLFWLLRRVFYVESRPLQAVLSSLLYCVTLVGSAAALRQMNLLTPLTAFIGMGVASLVTSAVFLAGRTSTPAPEFGEVARDHWQYGKWAIASSLVSWFPAQIYYALLPAWLGLEASGALRALTNFGMPALQAIAALNMLLLPALVRDRRSGGEGRMNQTMGLFFGLFAAGCLVYLGALWLLRDHVFQIFYGGRYIEYAGWPFVLTCLLPLGTCATAVLSNAIRALERPDRMFWAYLGSAASAAVFGIPLAAKFGVSGALAGIHLSSITLALILWWFYRSLLRQQRTNGELI